MFYHVLPFKETHRWLVFFWGNVANFLNLSRRSPEESRQWWRLLKSVDLEDRAALNPLKIPTIRFQGTDSRAGRCICSGGTQWVQAACHNGKSNTWSLRYHRIGGWMMELPGFFWWPKLWFFQRSFFLRWDVYVLCQEYLIPSPYY